MNRKALAFVSVALMICGAFVCLSMSSDDSDAANYSYTANAQGKITLSPSYGDVITITNVSSMNGCPYAYVNPSSHVATVTIPSMSAGKYVYYDSWVISDIYGGHCWFDLNTNQNWPTGRIDRLYSDLPSTIYVTNGTVFSYAATYDETDDESYYLDFEKATYVTPGVGLSIDGRGNLSGTVNAQGGTTFYVDWAEQYSYPDNEYIPHRQTFVVASFDQTVTFNANGGSCSTPSVTAKQGSAITLPSASKQYYSFSGWFTASSGGTRVGGAGDSYTVNSDITLYAQYNVIPVSITTTQSTAYIVQGSSFSYTVGTNPADANISVSGASWLTVSGKTVTGVPTSVTAPAGTYHITVTVTYGTQTAVQTFDIVVAEKLIFESVPTGGIIANPV